MTVTVAVCVIGTLPIMADTVLASAVVELSVPVATPPASVRPGCTSVLLRPVAARVTVAPGTGLPLASRAVTVMVDVALPATMLAGAALTVDCDALTAPALIVTALEVTPVVPGASKFSV